MPDRKWIQKSKGFSLIELMAVVAIISILAAIAIPNYISVRNKAYCSDVESDAMNVVAALSDYFSVPSHFSLPDISDLKFKPKNPVEISGDPNTTILITVKDRSGRCPKDYQTANESWDATTKTFTKSIDGL